MKTIKLFCLYFISIFNLNAQSYYNGEFMFKKIETYFDSSYSSKNYMACSNLYADTVNQPETWHADNLANVSFNGVCLAYNSAIRMYLDTIQRTDYEGMRWSISSSSGPISGFTTTCTNSFPSIQIHNFFPDTLRKSDSLYIYFGKVTNADKIELTMFDGVLRIFFPFNRQISPSKLSVSIPSSDLTSLEGDTVNLTLSLVKNEYQMHNGQRFRFEKRYNIVKTLRLIN